MSEIGTSFEHKENTEIGWLRRTWRNRWDLESWPEIKGTPNTKEEVDNKVLFALGIGITAAAIGVGCMVQEASETPVIGSGIAREAAHFIIDAGNNNPGILTLKIAGGLAISYGGIALGFAAMDGKDSKTTQDS